MARRMSPGEQYWQRPRPGVRCDLVGDNKLASGLVMAVPFVGCFALFGICNLVAGTIVTVMACKGKFPSIQNTEIFRNNPQLREQTDRMDSLLDPMKIVGPILLVTGATLVLVGLLLGVIACRSVYVQPNRSRAVTSASRNIAATSFGGPVSGPASFGGGTGTTCGNNANMSPKRTHSLSGSLITPRRQISQDLSPDGGEALEGTSGVGGISKSTYHYQDKKPRHQITTSKLCTVTVGDELQISLAEDARSDAEDDTSSEDSSTCRIQESVTDIVPSTSTS